MAFWETARARFRSSWTIMILCVVLLLFLAMGLREVYRVDGLFSYDPYYHLNMSKLTEAEQRVITEIQFYDGPAPINYVTALHPFTALLHEYTGLSYEGIFRVLGLLFRVLTALVLFITASYFLGSRKYALFATILFLSVPYVILRSLITFPENMVLPFHVLIFYCIIRGIREKEIDYALPVFISAALYIHYRSFIIPAVLLVLFLLLRKSWKYAVGLVASVALLSAPIIVRAVRQYIAYYHVNVGSGATLSVTAQADPRYSVPTLTTYQAQIGIVLLILAALAVPFLFRKFNREKLVLLVWLVFTFLLTRGKGLGLYLPTDRMMAYFSIPAALAAGSALQQIMESKLVFKKMKPALAIAVSLGLILFMTLNLKDTRGWVGVTAGQLAAGQWLNGNVPAESVIISFGPDLINTGANQYDKQSSRSQQVVCGENEVSNPSFEVSAGAAPSDPIADWEEQAWPPQYVIEACGDGNPGGSYLRISNDSSAPLPNGVTTAKLMDVDVTEPYAVGWSSRSDTVATPVATEAMLYCYDQADNLVGQVAKYIPCTSSQWASSTRTITPGEWPAGTIKIKLGITPKVGVEGQTAVTYLSAVSFFKVSTAELAADYPGKQLYLVTDNSGLLDGSAEVVFAVGKIRIYRLGAN